MKNTFGKYNFIKTFSFEKSNSTEANLEKNVTFRSLYNFHFLDENRKKLAKIQSIVKRKKNIRISVSTLKYFGKLFRRPGNPWRLSWAIGAATTTRVTIPWTEKQLHVSAPSTTEFVWRAYWVSYHVSFCSSNRTYGSYWTTFKKRLPRPRCKPVFFCFSFILSLKQCLRSLGYCARLLLMAK